MDLLDDPAFQSPAIDENTQLILLHASNHDLPSLKPLLRIPGNASVQDSETGFTPLHAAIAACGTYSPSTAAQNGSSSEDKNEDLVDLEKAKAVVQELFLSGAIWNDLDANDETPGCLAWRLGQKELYNLCVEAGVRAEVLLGLMGSYAALDSDDEEDDEGVQEDTNAANTEATNGDSNETKDNANKISDLSAQQAAQDKRDVNSEDYLASNLKITNDNLLDASNNGVMMTWESEIMRKTVDLLVPTPPPPAGPKVLNIGFGLGIIDTMFRSLQPPPQVHHIIEAHPDVLTTLSSPSHPFNQQWKDSTPVDGDYAILPGRWQLVVPQIIEQAVKYDIIYFDTFGEDYSQLKLFFQEYVPDLLEEGGVFGFFNGLGADRRVCYDVYTRVVEMDLQGVGMGVEWSEVDVPEEVWGTKAEEEKGTGEKGEWKGVRRRYWVLEKYRLPICRLDG